MGPLPDPELEEVAKLASDPSAAPNVRSAAVSRLMSAPTPDAFELAAELSHRGQPAEVRHLAIRWLTQLMDFPTGPAPAGAEAALDQARGDPDGQAPRGSRASLFYGWLHWENSWHYRTGLP